MYLPLLLSLLCAMPTVFYSYKACDISLSTKLKSAVGSVACGALAAVLSHKASENLEWHAGNTYTFSSLALIGVSTTLASWLGWHAFFQFTPEGKIQKVREHLDPFLDYYYLIIAKYANNEQYLLEALHKDYVAHAFPLVAGFHMLQNLRNTALWAQGLLKSAKYRLQSDSPRALECDQLFDLTKDIINDCEDALVILTRLPHWTTMVSVHDAHQALIVQEQMLLQMQINAIQPHFMFLR